MATILLVEDNADARDMMAAALEFGGHEVSSAANGREALQMLEGGWRPGLIVADLMMPVMSGWELRTALHDDPRFSSLPVLVVSALIDHDPQLGNTPCLGKPVDIDRMLALVDECAREPAQVTARLARS